MKTIVFFSKQALSYLQDALDEYVIDYFDIEAQKVLGIIGFSYKRSPFVMRSPFESGKTTLCFYDLDTYSFSSHSNLPKDTIGVFFECF